MHIHPSTSSLSTMLAAVIYMMTRYQQTHCPKLALAIATHLDCLSQHPEADEALRRVADCMHDEWHGTARNHGRPLALVRPSALN